MIRVRFPTGLCVTFNEATFCNSTPSGRRLSVGERGRWVATAPIDALIESDMPCKIEWEAVKVVAELGVDALEAELRRRLKTGLPRARRKRGA